MTRAFPVIVAIAVTAAAAPLRAQEPSAQATQSAQATAQASQSAQPAAQQPPGVGAASIVPLKLTITLSKYQGDKKVSSLPYELTVRTDNNKGSIRMTTQVPTPTFGSPNPAAADPAKPPSRIGPFVMRDVGTNIDCNATNLKDGRYAVTVTIEDSSIYEDSQRVDIPNGVKASNVSAVRTYRTTNALVLRDGQTTEFTTATDKVSGEVIKAAVMLTVIK